jgi:hypothetical protein
MTDERQPTPAEEDKITRLLAEAAVPAPAPPAVVERLDDVLAGLVAERSATSPPDPPSSDEVAAARARRRWPRLLLAAAAVVAGGYGVSAAMDQGVLGGSSSGGDASMSSDAGGAESDGRATASKRGGPTELNDRTSLTQLRSDRLDADVRRLLGDSLTMAPSDTPRRDGWKSAAPRDEGLALTRACAPRSSPTGDWHAVRLDGRRAVLVTEPEAGGAVVATVYSCAGDVLAGTVVAAP